MTNLWKRQSATLFVILAAHLIGPVHSNNKLIVAYEWKEMDFKYASADDRWSAIERHAFKPENVIPFGIQIYQTRLFVTLPRWRDGVPASLAYFDLNDTSTKSPSLIPYPSWEAHNLNEMRPELVSPFRVCADRCGRLWVLDSRISSVLENTTLYGPAQLLVYDLHDDNLLRRHVFPSQQIKQNSFFANLAIEDGDCENTFAYAGDLGSPGLVVYSWQQENSWRVQHNYFHPDPLAGNYSIGGRSFQWDDGLYGLALSKMQHDGFTTLYFHPLSSTMEFAVNTAILRNKTLATQGPIYKEFKILGSRGPNAQAGASFLHQRTGVLFYTLPNLYAVACWNSDRDYTENSQSHVYMSATEMVFPSDIKVDNHDRLWVLSNRLQEFLYGELFPNSINFRILTAHVEQAIENTACNIDKFRPLPKVTKMFSDILNTASDNGNSSSSTSAGSQLVAANVMFIAITIIIWFLR